MLNGPMIILTLKVLVSTVTVLFAASIAAIIMDNRKLHGRINTVFFILTMATVIGFEILLRIGTNVTSQFSEEAQAALRLHLYFAIPSAVILPVMMFSGVRHYRSFHVTLGLLFTLSWLGTFITGVFFIPHS